MLEELRKMRSQIQSKLEYLESKRSLQEEQEDTVSEISKSHIRSESINNPSSAYGQYQASVRLHPIRNERNNSQLPKLQSQRDKFETRDSRSISSDLFNVIRERSNTGLKGANNFKSNKLTTLSN